MGWWFIKREDYALVVDIDFVDGGGNDFDDDEDDNDDDDKDGDVTGVVDAATASGDNDDDIKFMIV